MLLGRVGASTLSPMLRLIVFLFLPVALAAHCQTLTWEWPNQPCTAVMHCDTGCSVCILPAESHTMLFGNNLARVGVDICPQWIEDENNALFTYGWGAFPDPGRYLTVAGIVLQPMQVDSILIRHRSPVDGPMRLEVRFGTDGTMPADLLGDVGTAEGFTETVFRDLGIVEPAPGAPYGQFRLDLRAYNGEGGSWDLDAVRIVTSPVVSTGIRPVVVVDGSFDNGYRHDALGRRVAAQGSAGVRFGQDGGVLQHAGRP